MYIDTPIGEVFDRLSIAMIKYSKTKDEYAGKHRGDLFPLVSQYLMEPNILRCFGTLMELNLKLWDLEDGVRREDLEIPNRACVAMNIAETNDRRARVKRTLSEMCGDDTGDTKHYADTKLKGCADS